MFLRSKNHVPIARRDECQSSWFLNKSPHFALWATHPAWKSASRLALLSTWQRGCAGDNVFVRFVAWLEAQARTLLIIPTATCCRRDIIGISASASGKKCKPLKATLLSSPQWWFDRDKEPTGQPRAVWACT